MAWRPLPLSAEIPGYQRLATAQLLVGLLLVLVVPLPAAAEAVAEVVVGHRPPGRMFPPAPTPAAQEQK